MYWKIAAITLLALVTACASTSTPLAGDETVVADIEQAKQSGQLSFTTVFNKNTVGESFANYRIPALAVTKQGTLLAFAEGRRIQDDHHKGPIVLRRSEDLGNSWQALQIIVEHGRDSLNNPTPVVLDSGRILLLYQRFPEDFHSRGSWSHGYRVVTPGLDGPKVQTNHIISSDDEGRTWSAPVDITAQTKRGAPVVANFTGPGPALVLSQGEHAGRIIVPSCDFTGEGSSRVFNSYSTYSDDQGKSWNVGEHAVNPKGKSADETQMVEMADGRLLMDVRASGNRMLATSSNGGVSWTPLHNQKDLPDSAAMGSVISYDLKNGASVLMHSGSTARIKGQRSRGAVYLSKDFGESWPKHRVYYPGRFDYSSIARLPNGDVGILAEIDFGVYGPFNTISFIRIKPQWLLDQ